MKNIFCNQEKKIKYRLFDKTEKLNAGHWPCITGSSLELLKALNTATPQI